MGVEGYEKGATPVPPLCDDTGFPTQGLLRCSVYVNGHGVGNGAGRAKIEPDSHTIDACRVGAGVVHDEATD